MERLNNTDYDTNLKIIGSIPDLNLIYDALKLFALGYDKEVVKKKLVFEDAFGIRTQNTRIRNFRVIQSSLIKFENNDHRQLIYDWFKKIETMSFKNYALYLHLAINNRTFQELTTQVFLKLYFSGRLTVDKSEFSSYLYELKLKEEQMNKWYDRTIDEVASKYLTLMKKLGFLRGKQKKQFVHIIWDDEILIFAIYLLKAIYCKSSYLFDNPYLKILPIAREGLVERIKKIALKDFFDVSFVGDQMSVDLKYDYGEVVDAIIEKYQ